MDELKGTGAVVGLSRVAKELGIAAARAKELAEQFKKDSDTEKLAREIAKSIPTIGRLLNVADHIKAALHDDKNRWHG